MGFIMFHHGSSWYSYSPFAHWKDLPHDLSGHVGPVRSLEKGSITGMMQEDHRGIRGEWLNNSYHCIIVDHITSYYKSQIIIIIGSHKLIWPAGNFVRLGNEHWMILLISKNSAESCDMMWYVYICLNLYVLHPNPNDPMMYKHQPSPDFRWLSGFFASKITSIPSAWKGRKREILWGQCCMYKNSR